MPNYISDRLRKDVIRWDKVWECYKAIDKDLSQRVMQAIDASIADRVVSTCCKSEFRKLRREFAENFPEKLEKILLRQSKPRVKGKVRSRH